MPQTIPNQKTWTIPGKSYPSDAFRVFVATPAADSAVSPTALPLEAPSVTSKTVSLKFSKVRRFLSARCLRRPTRRKALNASVPTQASGGDAFDGVTSTEVMKAIITADGWDEPEDDDSLYDCYRR